MTVRVDFGYTIASIDGGVWSCDDEIILRELKLMQDETIIFTSDPDPDYTLAKEAAERFDAEIIHHDELKRVRGREY